MSLNKLLYLAFIITLWGAGFFLAALTSLSPVYFTFILGILTILLISPHATFPKEKLIIANFLIFVLLLVVQAFLTDLRRPLISFLSHLYFIVVFWLGSHLTYKQLLKGAKIALYSLLPIFFVEFFLRLGGNLSGAVNALKTMDELNFYGLKVNSIMFMDTNHVAMVILPFYFLGLYLRKEHKVRTEFILICLFIFLLFTFSRAAIIATALFSLIFTLFRINKSFAKTLFILFLIGAIVLNFLIPFFINDPSFISKFEILQAVIDYTEKYDWGRLFFGVGYGNSPNYLGIGSHNLFLTYYVEGGIYALILIGSLYFLFINKTEKTLYIILPFILAGLSFAPQVQTFFYAVLAAVILLEHKSKLNEK